MNKAAIDKLRQSNRRDDCIGEADGVDVRIFSIKVELFNLFEPTFEIVGLLVCVGCGHGGEGERDEDDHSASCPVQAFDIDWSWPRGSEVVIVIDDGWYGEEDVCCMQTNSVFVDLLEILLFFRKRILLHTQNVVSWVKPISEKGHKLSLQTTHNFVDLIHTTYLYIRKIKNFGLW